MGDARQLRDLFDGGQGGGDDLGLPGGREARDGGWVGREGGEVGLGGGGEGEGGGWVGVAVRGRSG